MTPGELVSARERSAAAAARNRRRRAYEAELIRAAVLAILTRLAIGNDDAAAGGR